MLFKQVVLGEEYDTKLKIKDILTSGSFATNFYVLAHRSGKRQPHVARDHHNSGQSHRLDPNRKTLHCTGVLSNKPFSQCKESCL